MDLPFNGNVYIIVLSLLPIILSHGKVEPMIDKFLGLNDEGWVIDGKKLTFQLACLSCILWVYQILYFIGPI